MADEMFILSDSPTYQENIRKIKETDEVHERVVNPIFQKIIDNTQFIKKQQEAHTDDTTNPHAVTKAQIGLGNVDNTADVNKPISTAAQAALDGKSNISHTHTAAQVGAVPTSRKINGKELSADVALSASDVGLGSVNNTSDADKPISNAAQTALNGKANVFHTHAATDIAQDNSHLFVSEYEKAVWHEKSNPNLLDNWYFADPINQRGQTSYAINHQYNIDRWKMQRGASFGSGHTAHITGNQEQKREAHEREKSDFVGTSILLCQKHYKPAQKVPPLHARFPVFCKNSGFGGVKREYSVSNQR